MNYLVRVIPMLFKCRVRTTSELLWHTAGMMTYDCARCEQLLHILNDSQYVYRLRSSELYEVTETHVNANVAGNFPWNIQVRDLHQRVSGLRTNTVTCPVAVV